MTERPNAPAVAARRIHQGRIIAVDVDTVAFPDGSTRTLDVVRHPGASAVLPYLSDPSGPDSTILLIRQFRHAVGGWLLEIPAGRLEPGESPDACARRELLEETGCTASQLRRVTTIVTTPGFSDERLHVFVATGLTQGPAKAEPDEFIEALPMTISDALARIRSGEIADAKTIIAILFAAGFDDPAGH